MTQVRDAIRQSNAELSDFARRVRAGNGLGARFLRSGPVVVARAPGRLDVMGGIADYSGSLVLELPTREATFVALQRARDGFHVTSRLPGSDESVSVSISPDEWRAVLDADEDRAGQPFRARTQDAWAAYVAGVVHVVAHARGLDVCDGLRVLVESNVPPGKGLSSSAALEVATARALLAAFGVADNAVDAATLARLCQRAENRVVGAPCGIMDQMTSAGGRVGELLALRCQPDIVEGHVAVPDGLALFGIDSGIRHAVTGASYGSVRTGAFIGYRMIAEHAGLSASAGPTAGRVTIEDARWHGYLANIRPAEFAAEFADRLPERVSGRAFLDAYDGITDDVTRVDPDCSYAVRAPAAHPIRENARVEAFRDLIASGDDDARAIELGRLMRASHDSYSACGLGSDGTDLLVEMLDDAGAADGVWGARITGGGCGGTVAVLARPDAAGTIAAIATRYSERTDRMAAVFHGSSAGALQVACQAIEPA